MTNDRDLAPTQIEEEFDDLVEEVISRLEAGELLALDEYASRYPQYIERLQKLLPSIRAMVELSCTLGAGCNSPLASAVPPKVGRYRVIDTLGRGGFATVYVAQDDELQRRVVVKVPHPWRMPPDGPDNYVAEARVLAQLEHPAIVPIYDVGQLADGRCFIVSKYIAAVDLATLLRRGERPSHLASAKIMARIAEALQHAHQRGIVHRDVKPANILLDGDGMAYLADFGVALCDADFGRDVGLAGTVSYMSPEQARGEGHLVDGRSDIYSLGVVLYELLTGSTPFRRGSRAEQIDEILHATPRPPRQLNANVSPELEAICLKCLAKNPAERYSAADDLAVDLRRWIARQRLGVSRRGLATAAVAGLALILAGIVALPRFWSKEPIGSADALGQTGLIETVELHVRRDRDDKRIESWLLVSRGIEQDNGPLAPLDSDDHLKLFVEFKRPTNWFLVHFDPDGGFDIVDRSEGQQAQLEFPRGNEMASFKPDDPKGINLLLLLVGDLPADGQAALDASLASLNVVPQQMPPRWSRLRAGMTKEQALAQVPALLLKDIEPRLPPGVKPAHALFLRTIAGHRTDVASDK